MNSLIRSLIALLVTVSFLNVTQAQNALFTYQGRVTSNGTNFTGTGQFKFALVTSTNFNHQATATANPPSGGFVTIVNVTFGGNGYASPPAVTISGGGGSGATAHANLSSGVVTSILVDSPGSGYSSTPFVAVAPPPANITYTTYWSNDGTSVAGSEPTAFVNVNVNGGLFTVALGDATLPNMAPIATALFTQPDLQLRMWFNNGVSGFAVLNPVQSLTPTPYAIQSANAVSATTASSANSVAAGNILGTLGFSQLPPGLVTNSQNGVNFTGAFAGNGGALSNLSPNSLVLSATDTSITFWGYNVYNQRSIPSNLNDATVLGLGISHSLALRANGTLVAWGAGQVYAPSNGFDYGQSIIPPGLSNVMGIAVGALHNVTFTSNGTVVAWGAGQTFNPTNDQYENGQSIVPPTLNNVIGVGAGLLHSAALKSDRTVVAWGAGTTLNPTNGYEFGQSIVPPGLNGVAAISLGYAHTLALRTNGTIVAWGAGQLNGTNSIDYGQSVVPAGLSNVIAISAGGIHNLALKSDGTVVAWGAGTTNDQGVTGINWGQSIVPPGLSNVVDIQAGLYHSVALKADGTVVAWGDNSFAQCAVPPGLDNILKLGHGSITAHNLALRKHSTAPVAWLDSDNTFNGNIQVNGDMHIAGELSSSNGFRLNDANLWLRAGLDQQNGLGWYGETKPFGFIDTPPDGPILFGNNNGALGTTTNGSLLTLFWNSSRQVGIGTITPTARLSLGDDFDISKFLIVQDYAAGYGIGALPDQFRFHLSGNSTSERFSFFTAPSGTELFSISANGNIAMHGTLSMGTSPNLYAPTMPENVRIIRGTVSSTGGILFGTGFTVAHPAAGQYTISFSQAFSDSPTVTVTAQSITALIATCASVGPTSSGIRIWGITGTGSDNQFDFIAIGQR